MRSLVLLLGMMSTTALAGFSELKETRPIVDGGQAQVSPRPLADGQTATITYRNPTWSGRTAYIHYGFDGWNRQTFGPDAGEDLILGNRNYYIHSRMVESNQRGVWHFDLEIPEGARALHYVFCVDECEPGYWDNAESLDFAEPVAYPFTGPVLTWNDDTTPGEGIVVTWESGYESTGWIEIAPRGGRWHRFRRSEVSRQHRFVMTGMVPGTSYRYRVGDEAGGVSPTYQLDSPDTEAETLKFLLFGDSQDDGERRFDDVAKVMVRDHSDVDFLLSTGDLAWNDGPGEWWTFFDRARELLATKPLVAVVGNHDTPGNSSDRDTTSFRYYFDQKYDLGERAAIDITVGPARFLGMNSEIPSDFDDDEARQYRWLRYKVQNRRFYNATWNFALWHIPAFNAGARHYGQQRHYKKTAELLAGNIDWQFSGHEHMYQRMDPLVQVGGRTYECDQYGIGSNDGVGHLVVPSAGVDPNATLIRDGASLFDRSMLAYPDVPLGSTATDSTLGFIRIELTGRSFWLRTYNVDPDRHTSRLLDEVRYTK